MGPPSRAFMEIYNSRCYRAEFFGLRVYIGLQLEQTDSGNSTDGNVGIMKTLNPKPGSIHPPVES